MKTTPVKRKPCGAAAGDPAGFGRRGGSSPHSRRTHWAAGKRRNPPEPWLDWDLVRRNLREVGRMRRTAELARLLGVSRKTVYRWRSGEDVPSAETQAKLLKFFTKLDLPLF